jgi:hypothetical protein
MKRFAFMVLAVSLTLSIGCKRQETSGAGSGSAAAAGSAATGSAVGAAAGGSAADPAGGSAAGGSAAGGSAAGGAAAGSGSAAAGGAAAGSAAGNDGAATASGGAASADGMAHKAGMCPSMVFGSKTTARVKGRTVVLKIESNDKDAIAAIQKRTDKLLGEKKGGPPGGAVHDQKGAHGGAQGLCPVYVPEGARASFMHEAKGVTVAITPDDKSDALAKEISGRVAKAAEWVKANVKEGDKGNQGGVGGGSGEDGSNHSGKGDGKGHERKKGGGGGKGTGGGGGAGTGGGDGSNKPS